MANLRDIRRRIKSVKNTAQITKAMQLVAASKMKKAQDQAVAGRSYADLLNKVLVNLKEYTGEEDHPLLKEQSGERELVILVTTDKGLCGPLNTNLLRLAMDQVGKEADFITIGNKGRQALVRVKRNIVADFSVKDPVAFLEVKPVAEFVMEKFLAGDYDKVTVAFTNFKNTISQEPLLETLLPISPIELGKAKGYEGVGKDEVVHEGGANYGGYIFEPDARGVLDMIVPQYVGYQLYQMVLESRASEHSARMVAMKAATDNAKQMIKDLTLDYNKQRQAAITSELLEITTAMRALE
ncbi:MAG: ATP synthase F1 subunit gamma [Verrucomicrobiales bacterium]|jgi:F-type H+-transporting ATPase subunit gamma|nr:ATP synthase F1 subunit gamma [Verrucomicrobiales bacterium]MDP4638410.1 ATP synthase F1 subunit gamma [Verrucomicrobiales bacterium]MDP4793620.1 ATP synthase F1 subunit gamma [Verrucomicrobiales bacterium]MDP4939393.1 ATP synthase F1 subunit gamma [Verrucomicrobiales bacterium]MDP5004644.1 ATP synthase F1 subunit gamma [Verrucomicrobiales bacterium]